MSRSLDKLRILFIALLLLGVLFRFVNLDKGLYWYDETVTSVRSAGYIRPEIVQQVFDGHEIGVEDLQIIKLCLLMII